MSPTQKRTRSTSPAIPRSRKKKPTRTKAPKKLLVAAALGEGASIGEAAAAAKVHRATIWRWATTDAEFARLLEECEDRIASAVLDDAVGRAVARLRDLAEPAVEAFQRGLAADHTFRPMKVRRFEVSGEGEEPAVVEAIEVVGVPDLSLSVRTADLVTRRIAELMPRQGIDVEVAGTLEARIRERDARATDASD